MVSIVAARCFAPDTGTRGVLLSRVSPGKARKS